MKAYAFLGVKGSRVQNLASPTDTHNRIGLARFRVLRLRTRQSRGWAAAAWPARTQQSGPVRSADVGTCELGDTPDPATAIAPAIERCGIVGRNQIGPTVVTARTTFSSLS